MSDSRNNIPEEEPLGGFYDEEEEKKKLDSAKDFARDRKDDILDLKDNIDNVKDVIEQMKNSYEVSYKSLKYTCDPSIFRFETTADVKTNYRGFGQQRGIASLEFGLSVDTKGYNVYLEGPTGSGKTTYTKEYLDKISRTKKVPPDWVYVYNFDDPNEPVAISLTAGEGIKFKDSMEKFIKDIRHDIKNTFKSDDLEKEKSIITREFEERKEKLLSDLNKKSAKYGFQVKSSETGIYMMPIINGKVIKEDEFEKLDAKVKKEYEDKSEIVQQEIIEVISKIKALDDEAENRINDWRTNIALLTITGHIYYVKSNLKRNKKVSTFLDGVKKDILKNISKFIEDDNCTNIFDVSNIIENVSIENKNLEYDYYFNHYKCEIEKSIMNDYKNFYISLIKSEFPEEKEKNIIKIFNEADNISRYTGNMINAIKMAIEALSLEEVEELE